MAVVVLPTPPFWLATTSTRGIWVNSLIEALWCSYSQAARKDRAFEGAVQARKAGEQALGFGLLSLGLGSRRTRSGSWLLAAGLAEATSCSAGLVYGWLGTWNLGTRNPGTRVARCSTWN